MWLLHSRSLYLSLGTGLGAELLRRVLRSVAPCKKKPLAFTSRPPQPVRPLPITLLAENPPPSFSVYLRRARCPLPIQTSVA